MSGVSTQGVGAAASANADVVSAVSAAAIKKLLVANLVILVLPGGRSSQLVGLPMLEQTTNAIHPSICPVHSWRRATLDFRLCDFPHPTSRLSFGFSLEPF